GEIEAAPDADCGRRVVQYFEGWSEYPDTLRTTVGDRRYGAAVYWSEKHNAHAVWGGIGERYEHLGSMDSGLGMPTSDQFEAAPSPSGTTGVYQRFESIWDYPADVIALLAGIRCGATVYWTEEHGTHATWGAIGELYERLHGTAGRLGFPVTDELERQQTSS